jgi:3-oxoacyl-[acyl-carrier protein] reductase
MALDLTGTIVIVTGAAGGLGRAMSLGLVAAGASVAAFDLPSADGFMAELIAAAREHDGAARLRPFNCDVTSPAQCDGAVAAAAAHFGALHGLVNCAGLGPHDLAGAEPGRRRKFFEVGVELWRSRIETNLTGPFIMARTVAPRLVARGGGKIVNVTTS